MTTRDELIVKFTADIADFNRKLSEVQTKVTMLNTNVTKQTDRIGSSFRRVGGFLAGYLSVQVISNFTGSVINLADKVDMLSNKTGLSTTFLQGLNYSAIDAGISLDTVANSISKLQVNLGSGNKGATKVLEALGLDAETLKKQSPDKAFLDIIKRLEMIQDRSVRLAAGTALFGRGYKELELLVAEGSEKIEENLSKSVPTPEQIEQLANFKDEWEKFSLSIKEGAIPVLTGLLNILNGISNIFSDSETKENMKQMSDALTHFGAPKSIEDAMGGLISRSGGTVISGGMSTKPEGDKFNAKQEAAVAEATKKSGNEAAKAADKFRDRAEAIKENIDADYALAKATEELDKLMKDGYLTSDEHRKAVEALKDDYWDLQRTVADDLTDAFNRPIRSISDFREIALDALQKIAIQAIITGFKLDKMSSGFGGSGGGGVTSGLGSLLGSGIRSILGFAEGGEPPLNRPSIVGERGAELFVPKTAGRIIPNDMLTRGSSGSTVILNQSLNFATGVQDTVRAEIIRMMPTISRTTQEAIISANSRGGAMSIIMNNRS
jgi:hypothetical protein